jgi:hypothetical protein
LVRKDEFSRRIRDYDTSGNAGSATPVSHSHDILVEGGQPSASRKTDQERREHVRMHGLDKWTEKVSSETV